ncbi:MAG: diguanylate cyclase [Thermaerobacter sp.]|nr:diguanylate cyclase [Thermaerobacter sp.]
MTRRRGIPRFSLRLGVLLIVIMILADLAVMWTVSSQNQAQMNRLVQTFDPYHEVTMRLNTDFALYDGALNMYVGLDAEAPASLRQSTLDTIRLEALDFAGIYREAWQKAPNAAFRTQLRVIHQDWARYQKHVAGVEAAMAAGQYPAAILLQDVKNVAATAALSQALARLVAQANAQTVAIASGIQARAARNVLQVMVFQGLLLALILGVAWMVHRSTRRLLDVLAATAAGDFSATAPSFRIQEYAFVIDALNAMRASVGKTLKSLEQTQAEQERIIAERTRSLRQYATTVENVLESTRNTLRSWDNSDAIAEIKQALMETLGAAGCVSLDRETGVENDRWGSVPWPVDQAPDAIRRLLPVTRSTPVELPADVSRGRTLLVPWRSYRVGRSVLVILWDDSANGMEIDQKLVDLSVTQAESLWTTILLFRETQHQAVTDQLTGLGNRRLFESSLLQRFGAHPLHPEPFQLVLADLDHLKAINDSRGHAAGDIALQRVARSLQTACVEKRVNAELFRIGGDEFALLLAVTDPLAAQDLIAQTQAHLGDDLTLSAGTACYPTAGTDAHVLFRVADWALYQAKAAGRQRTIAATFNTMLAAIRQEDAPDTPLVLAALLDNRLGNPDDYTLRLAQTARAVARALAVSTRRQEILWLTALLHDFGRLAEAAPNSLATGPDEDGTLSDLLDVTGELLAVFPRLRDVAAHIVATAERWDGSGPAHLQGDAIPLDARILAAVDAFFRIRHHRRRSLEEAREWLRRRSGSDFDPAVVTALLALPVVEP